jgi:16S rRNA (guanine966-N2)-methyltransferase
MRVIAGLYKGRRLDFPKTIRPTQDKVRQAVMNCLAQVVLDARVLDLYAGSGAYGIEAISRGAREVWFIDRDRACTSLIEKNLQKIAGNKALPVSTQIYTNDANRALEKLAKRCETFDLVILDPPYGEDEAKKSLKTLGAGGILPRLGFVVVEHARNEDLPEEEGTLRRVKELRHGLSRVSIYQRVE